MKIKDIIAFILVVAGMIYVAGMDTWTYLATGILP